VWGIVERDGVLGYTDRHSIMPRESFRIMLATEPGNRKVRGHVEIYRVGSYVDPDRNRVWRSDSLEVRRGEVFETSASVGLTWPAVNVDAGDDWMSGYCNIDFVTSKGKRIDNVAFIVVTHPAKSGDGLAQAHNQRVPGL
jgi:hypothetical protein